MKKILSAFSIFIFFYGSLVAQEVVDDLKYNHQLKKEQLLKAAQGNMRAGAAIVDTLPFIDDFSYLSAFPDPDKWQNKLVYVNRNYPIDPPSIGVATFDALDENGVPYAPNSSATASADTLTSQPLNLNQYLASDSLLLSFYYQAKGLGNLPEPHDSLVLEFLEEFNGTDTIWRKMWSIKVGDAPTNSFALAQIRVSDNAFLYDGFQFRFRNYATLSGNNDHWHIDYVILDKNRSVNDTLLNDVAFYRPTTPLLKNYRSMPLNQFIGYENNELADSFYIFAKNHFNTIKNTTFRYYSTEDCSNSTIKNDIIETINFPPLKDTSLSDPVFKNEIASAMAGITCDSLVITTGYLLSNTPPDLSTSFNDTILQRTEFYNYLAYDDGSAEQAYGLVGAFAQFAMEFNLNEPDTLQGIMIHFAHVDKDVDHLSFSLKVWNDIAFNGGTEDPLYVQNFQLPTYVDEINGFYTYILDTPQVVSGKFYIGFLQENSESLRMGFDLNSNAKSKTFYNIFGNWNQSLIDGAVMMRPVLGGPIPLSVEDPKNQSILVNIYPNPVKEQLHIDLPKYFDGEIYIFDYTGKMILSQKGYDASIDVQLLTDGMYILQAKDHQGKVYTSKFIKLH